MARRLCVFLIGLTLGLFGLSASHAAAQGLQHVNLGIGGRTLLSYLPVTLAERLGYYRDAGLEVKLNDFQGGSKSLQALVGGSVDFVSGAYENTLFMQEKGIELKAIGVQTVRAGYVFGLSKALAAKYRSPADLKGLKIGVTAPGSALSNALEIILAKGGLTVKDVSVIGVGGGAGAIAAMKTGQIDGIVLSDPVIMRLELDGAISPIVDSRTEEGQIYLYGGPAPNASVYTTAKFAAANPALVQSFVTAFARAMKWLSTASVDEVVAVVPPDFYGADKQLYAKALAANKAIFSTDGHLTLDLANAAYHSMAGSGRLAAGKKLDIPATVDDSYWQAANKR